MSSQSPAREQRVLYQELRAEALTTRERLAARLRPLDLSQLNEHPEPKGWSVAEVLEHLCIADELYEPLLATVLRDNRPDAGAPVREWKPTFIGGMIASTLINPKPVKGPKVFRPGPTPRNGIVEEILARETNFVAAMDGAADYDWRRLKLRSPALPSWAPKMNLGDGFRIHVVHVVRHTRQVERVIGKL